MRLPVYYRPEMSVEDNPSFSPSAGKPAAVVTDWRRHALSIEVMSFAPVTRQDLTAVHEWSYVEGVFEGIEDNGFGNNSPAVAAACRFTCGSMVAAALHAARHCRERPSEDWLVCSPSSGFHHAGYDGGGGYCTFNGLALAAVMLAREGFKAAILDLDQHWGNGTADIIGRLRLDVPMYSFRGKRPSPRDFLAELPSLICKLTEGRDVLLYQAGVDPHVDDPLGGYMTTEELRKRDEYVFVTCLKQRVPVAWNLAGGYQRARDGSIAPTLALHRNTMEQAADVMKVWNDNSPYRN